MIAIILLVLAVPVMAYRVTDISVVPSGDRTQVTIVTDGPISYEKFLLTDPMRVVIDLGDALHALPATDFAVSRGGVNSIRTSQYKAPPDGIVRVIVDVNGELMNYSTSLQEENRLVLVLNTDPAGTPFTSWSASSQEVEQVVSGGNVPPLSNPTGNLSGASTGSMGITQGIQVSEPGRVVDDGFPVEWNGTGGRRITIDVVDADIRTVMRSISDVSGMNIVIPESYQGTVTARLRNIGWRDALRAVLDSQDLMATMSGTNTLRIMKREDFYTEINQMAVSEAERENLQDLLTEVFIIRYAQAEDIQNATQSVLSERGQVSVDNRTNSLIVSDIPRKLNELGRLLPILDSPTAQVMIEAKLVEIDASASQEFGIDWSAGNMARTDALTHGGMQTNLGVGDPTGSVQFGHITDILDVNATVNFLEQQNRAHILSEPRIAICDNMTGRVLSGKQVPLTLRDADGNTYVQLYDVGVSLEVTPHINADNNVTLELNPIVSDLSGESTAEEQPIILTQEAHTTLMIDDGATAVIGGIMRSKTTELEKKVPILGHIPLLGDWLFSYTSTVEETSELVIFVTPHIIRPY
ncbi:MAG TPA: AMIN domain-containing protein [Candidatus Sabulitectum sp.]|nr:AMIN domain-containing protein [Candidatus Sabulitectum sp.]HPF32153.1 AMIN domain-containing protein [Candidatus Sabulitectum sp.]HPR22477.1 AMIN domain-containing protein [Candidatus Sabulitectum sp.]